MMSDGGADTIFALASGAGRAGVAVIRVSGALAADVLAGMVVSVPPARRATLRTIRAADRTPLDDGLVIWFPGPASFTGEDVAELHVHGGVAVIAAVEGRLRELGARPADAGEFSRRAFLNGRLDLLQAEAMADLVEAETEAQRQQAFRQMGGELSALYGRWAHDLRRLLALQEARIDFPDEAGDAAADATVTHLAEALTRSMTAHLDDGRQGERLREGVVICVTGKPNVGKSSLVNRLARAEVAIVSPDAGTTRDLIETRLVLGGVPVTIVDTAGLRAPLDAIEAEGIKRAQEKAATADLVLRIVAGETGQPVSADNVVTVANKIDLGRPPDGADVGVSARTGAGLEELTALLEREVARVAGRTPHPAITRGRHRACVEMARDHLLAAMSEPLEELRGEELRLAMAGLGRLTGQVGVEDVLDTIFSSFCIGK